MTLFSDLVNVVSQGQLLKVEDCLSHRVLFNGMLCDLPYFTFEKIFKYEVVNMFVGIDGRTLFVEVNE